MKRIFLLLFLTMLSACVAAGCRREPEKHIHVQEKTELNTDSYRQASDPSEEDKGSEDSDNGSDSARRAALAGRLQVPETYTFSREFPNSSVSLSCRAKIDLPDADQVSVCKVSQKPFDQDWIDRVTHAFFGDLPVYESARYQQPTKEWAREKLRRLKAFQAQGITDPYGHIASSRAGGSKNPEIVYNLEEDIEHWEMVYQNAPETVQKVKVSPGFDPSAFEANAAGDVSALSSFSGIVEMDGNVFDYFFKKSGPSHMEIRVLRESGKNPDETWFGYDWWPYASVSGNDHAPSSEIAERIEEITPSQAIETADQYMEDLGLTDFSAKYTEESVSYCVDRKSVV